MNVLITGGAGYLGSVLASWLLERGSRVRIMDSFMYGARSLWGIAGHDGLEILRGDVRSASDIGQALRGMDAVVHLAAIVGDPACARQPELARAVNLDASLALADAAREAGIGRFVFASTCSNYGRLPDDAGPATEDTELRPLSLYAETKVAVERHLLDSPASGMASTVLRFATLYGLSPRMRFDLTVNEFVLSLFTERRLLVYGERFWRPYVHVRDAARAVAAVLDAPRETVAGGVFNVGDSAENYRKMDLVALITRRLPGCETEYVTKAEDPRDYRVSFERIRTRLGYSIARRVSDGIDEIISALELGLVEQPRSAFHHNTAAAA